MFPRALDPRIILDPRTREIQITNNQYVLVDGLNAIERILIDGIEMPMESMRPFWKQDPGKEEEVVMSPVPILTVQDVPGVGKCLLRSIFSNHGEWQVGSRLMITGDWNEGPEEQFMSNLTVIPMLEAKDKQIAAAEEVSTASAQTAASLQAERDELADKLEQSERDRQRLLGSSDKSDEIAAKDAEIAALKEQLKTAPPKLTDALDAKDKQIEELKAKLAEATKPAPEAKPAEKPKDKGKK